MSKPDVFLPRITFAVLLFCALASCNNNNADIPFPAKEAGLAQPLSRPLKFSAAKKLNWVTTKTGAIKPDVKKLDIDALPATHYDSVDFRPFTKPPVETSFSFANLPSVPFNLEKLPSISLKLKTSILLSLTKSNKKKINQN